MGLNEVREKYLSFFESKGHLRMPSFSLVPKNDNSLLLINSGMAPMKKFFTGEITPPRNRVTTCQKCIRTPDIERVGKTARHGTYFEMLGNFSFGDYFKEDAIKWAWEFLTCTLEIPSELLWPSVYEQDDEAYAIWSDVIGVDKSRIVKLGKADNFWEHGTGPCGPCSEIYFDRGEKYGCGSPDCKPGCDCDRYMEIWNNVFSQFNNMGDGTYTELKQKNIDTGMGLERLACVLQGVDNLFEVDTVSNIMSHISKIAGVAYKTNEKTDISLRVITDHIRSTTFMIGDGVMPTNEGRGYVLRRLLRRAARHGRLLGIKGQFLSDVCDTVIEENKNAYPNLIEKRDFIKMVIKNEEQSFDKTIDQGLSLLNSMIENTKDSVLSGEDAFKLYDTFGFPVDLTIEILSEKKMTVDTDGFEKLMSEQKERARANRKAADKDAWAGNKLPLDKVANTEFIGYDKTEGTGKVLAIVYDGQANDSIIDGTEGILILDKTVFYAQSGGQVGDTGIIKGKNGEFAVEDTHKTQDGKFTHIGKMLYGEIKLGEQVEAVVDSKRRAKISANHSAVHLLQAALRKVLGSHVEQAGSLVEENRLRFDFSHFSAVTKQQLSEVEKIVNDNIADAINITMTEMPIEQAKQKGAMALFSEKYGDVVRVVEMKDASIELCGGIHTDNSAKIGVFKIVSESSVAAGVRRIEAVCGSEILKIVSENEKIINAVAANLKANVNDLEQKSLQLAEQNKQLAKQIESLNAKIAAGESNAIIDKAVGKGTIKVICSFVKAQDMDQVKTLADVISEKLEDYAVCLMSDGGEKISIYALASANAIKDGVKAGDVVKKAIEIIGNGGGGGGKPDNARGAANRGAETDKGAIEQKLANAVCAMILG